jgi:hypothetical protein
MLRFSVPYVWTLTEALVALQSIKQGDILSSQLFAIFNGENLLHQFLYQSLWKENLRVCIQPGVELENAIKNLYIGDDGNPVKSDDEIASWRLAMMQQKLTAFKNVLEAEFMTAATYLVIPRRGYDIATLIDAAEVIFPPGLVEKISEIKYDLREAGKCIAFDLGTAAGFHLMRALETVIKAYWNAVMEGAPLPTNRNLGAYIREMEDAHRGDSKVLGCLRQIKDLHRNELIHPEEKLDLDQAIALLGIVQSAIVFMLVAIPEPPTPETNSVIEALAAPAEVKSLPEAV